ncbi:YadA-like family protein [Brucella abortus]|uniref:YadA-like family protein n=2 Tax=Brucella abortus TaxID=235 RepID=UPI001FFD487E
MFGLSVNHAYAGPGIFINDGTDDGCIWTFDKEDYSPIGDYFGNTAPADKDSAGRNSPASVKYHIPSIQQLGGAATLKCLSKDRDTQTDRVLFYGNSKEQGSISLTLGGELFVNNGNLGLGGGTDTKAMRIGSMATLTGPSGLRSLAIGAGEIATVASGDDAIAIGTAAQAAHVGSIALGLQSTTELPSLVKDVTINGIKLSAFAGSNPASVLSIGNDTLKRSITNVGAGRVSKDSTDAVNGSQLYAVAEQATLGWNLTANGTDKSRVSPGDTVDLSNSDGNFVIGKHGTGVTFNLAPDLKVTSLVAGNTFLDTNGLVITGGPSMTVFGIDAAHLNIRHVADGAVTATSTDAVNGRQLFAVSEQAASGWRLTVNGMDKSRVAPGDMVDLSNSDGNLVLSKHGTGVTFNLAPDLKVTSLVAGNTFLDTNGLVITGGPSMTVSGIDAGHLNIRHVADGAVTATSTDAVNGRQLFAVSEQAASGWSLTVNGMDKSRVGPGDTVDLSNSDGNLVLSKHGTGVTFNLAPDLKVTSLVAGNTFLDTNGLVITGGPSMTVFGIDAAHLNIRHVADGAVTATSTDAVNGRQLFAVSEQAASGWSLTVNGMDKSRVAPGDMVDLSNSDGNLVLSKHGTGVTFNLAPDLKVTSLVAGNTFLDTNGLVITGGPSMTVFGIDAAHLNIRHVADGAVTATSTDAVNGRQLFAVSEQAASGWRLTVNGMDKSRVAPGDMVDLSNSDGNLVLSKHGTGVTFNLAPDLKVTSLVAGNTFLDTNGLVITGGPSMTVSGIDAGHLNIRHVADGAVTATSTDAVNGRQLFAVSEQAASGWSLTVNGMDKSRVGPGDTVDLSNSDGNLVLSKHGTGVTFNLAPDLKVTSLVAGNTFLDTNGLVITGGPSMTVSGIDAGQLKISHVADGAVTVTSTDAVNGSQLHRVAHTIAEHLGGDAHVNADGSVIGPQYTVQKKRYKTIYDAFGGVDENLSNINDILHDIESGGGIKYFHANSIGADSRALGTNSIAVGSDSVASGEGSISVGNGAQASAHGSVALGENAAAPDANSVALGAGSKTSEVVATKGTTINGQYYDFAGDAPSGTVSVGDKGAERTITNVAAGRISVESTDAVNGSQLNAVNQAIENLAAGVTENDKFSVKYDRHSDGTKKNSMTLQGWDSATPVVLANVADGVHKNDAVNVSQLKAGLSTTLGEAKAYTDQTALQTLDQANAYTDKKFGKLNEDIVATRIEARQAAAIGLAAASLRYDDRPGKISAAIGGGFWRGEGAVALGLGHTSEDQRMRSNLSAATSGGNWGMGAGFSYTFN